MGLFFRGIPHSLLHSVKVELGPSFVAVESGTYKGTSAKKLSKIADHVTSIEANQLLFAKAKRSLSNYENVALEYGDSGLIIGSVLPKDHVNCLIWLDAHYSGGNTAGVLDHCPLLNELRQILPSRMASNTIVLIDDSRGLIGKSGWPLLSELVGLLNEYGFSSIIMDDVLIASSTKSLGAIADNFSRSRTSTFERLGGRLSLVTGLVGSLGFITSTAFKIKHATLFSKK
jgi:hypothetical protein